ncbi:hypothetical protein [Streptomyces sp. NBC_01022]|uniref:hypothetical protein n=1 Tax=Streptomyces sp. NBC_01022 TaxID=2903723 RepID=UPI002DD7F66C|nr:hypothetical protein [Streptomyces sp. NBC_01022]WRZ83595.1 hypothetical protein OG316_26775 [Streptomyces sp. NBC_01022]
MGGPAVPARRIRLRRLSGVVVLLTPLLVAGSVSAPQGATQAVAAAADAPADTGRIAFAGTGHRSLGLRTSETTSKDLFSTGPAHYDQDAFGLGRTLVFTSLRDEAKPQVYLRDADGAVRKLTDGLDAAHPELSPDGRTVVFDAAEPGPGESTQRDLWSIGVDGSASSLKRLTESPANETHPTLSPDGTRIAYASDGGPEQGTQVYTQDLSSGVVTCISNPAEGDASEPEWNPVNDDAHRDTVVYTLRQTPESSTDTGHRLRITRGQGTGRPLLTGAFAGWGSRSAAWAPDGNDLVFLSPNTDCGCSVYDHVYRIGSLDNPVPVMKLSEDRQVESPAVIDWGNTWNVVVTHRTTVEPDLVTLQDMRQDGSDPRDLRVDVLREDPRARTNTSEDPADDPLFHPAAGYDPWTERQTYTPDGRNIAVTRFETIDNVRVQRIWLAPTDGTNPVAMDLEGRGAGDWDTDPSYSPDGTKLAFTRTSPPAAGDTARPSRVLVADVATKKIIGEVVPPAGEVVGGDAQPAWSSDGTTLAFTRNQVIRGLGGIKHVWTAPVDALEQQEDLSTTGCPGECKVIDDSPAFSPDGTAIAFNRKDRADQINHRASVVVTSPNGEGCRVVLPSSRRNDPTACRALIPDVTATGPYQPRDVAWSADAKRLVLSSRRDIAPNSPEQLSELVLATGTLTPLTAQLPGRQKEPAFQQQVDLALTAPPVGPSVEAGSSVTLTVTVTNHGPAPSPGTTFVADVPPGVRLEELTTDSGSCGAGSPACDLGVLAPGAEVEVTARLTGVTTGPWQIGWSVTGAVVDPNPTDNATGTAVQVNDVPPQPSPSPSAPTPAPPTPSPAPPAQPPAPLPPEPEAGPGVVVRAQPSPGYVGGRVVVTYTVRNGKNALATGLRLRLGLPAGIPVTTLPAGCRAGVCTLPDLTPGASSVLRVVLAPDRALRTKVTGTLTTSGTDADRGDNVSRIPLRILQPRIVSVPEVGKPGFVTSVRGKDFPPGVPVKLTWKPGITATAPPTRPGGDGTFIAQLLILVKDRTGPRTITASGPGFSPVTTDFLVVTGTIVPPDEVGRR